MKLVRKALGLSVMAAALAALPAATQFIEHVHAQAGAAVALDYVGRWDVADDAVDAAVTRDGRFDIRDQVNEFLGGVRLEFATLPVFIQFCIGK